MVAGCQRVAGSAGLRTLQIMAQKLGTGDVLTKLHPGGRGRGTGLTPNQAQFDPSIYFSFLITFSKNVLSLVVSFHSVCKLQYLSITVQKLVSQK